MEREKKHDLSASWAARFLHGAYIAVFRGKGNGWNSEEANVWLRFEKPTFLQSMTCSYLGLQQYHSLNTESKARNATEERRIGVGAPAPQVHIGFSAAADAIRSTTFSFFFFRSILILILHR